MPNLRHSGFRLGRGSLGTATEFPPATCVAEERNTMKSLKAAAVVAGSLIAAGSATPAFAHNAPELAPTGYSAPDQAPSGFSAPAGAPAQAPAQTQGSAQAPAQGSA